MVDMQTMSTPMGTTSTEQLPITGCDLSGVGSDNIRTAHGQELLPNLAGGPSILPMGDDDSRSGG
eukprot:11102379-Karenia_brevis.AAC.1